MKILRPWVILMGVFATLILGITFNMGGWAPLVTAIIAGIGTAVWQRASKMSTGAGDTIWLANVILGSIMTGVVIWIGAL